MREGQKQIAETEKDGGRAGLMKVAEDGEKVRKREGEEMSLEG